MAGLLPACAAVPGRPSDTTGPSSGAATTAPTTAHRPPRPPPRRPCPPCRCRPRCSGRRAGACSAAASPCRSTTASPRWGRSGIALARSPGPRPRAAHRLDRDQPRRSGRLGHRRPAERAAHPHPELLDRFDIVSFDPRGVQRSSPVWCNPPGQAPPAPSTPGPLADPIPMTPAAQQALITNDQEYAAQCEAQSGSILPFVGTVDTAMDLDDPPGHRRRQAHVYRALLRHAARGHLRRDVPDPCPGHGARRGHRPRAERGSR